MPTGVGCCDALDYTISRIPTGYLLGQVQPRLGPGPWWTYIAIFKTYDEAMASALALAERHGRLAWLHKGGDDNGLFVQVTAVDPKDPEIPGAGYGFATLKMAQALGDFQAFEEHNLRVMRLHLAKVVPDLAVVAKMIRGKGALSKKK